MKEEIKIINLPLPFRMGSVNCYLIKTASGFVLIDTGGSKNRKALEHELESAGCKPGLLTLIMLTHGDFDHTGNAAYVRQVFGGKIAMHRADAGMVEHGDMFVNRKKPNVLIRTLLPLFTGFGKAERFTPDLLTEDGYDLSEFGFDAQILSIPGHSKGSIGILTGSLDFFCGDLLENIEKPTLNSLVDEPAAMNASLQKLESMEIGTVYPGHGQPFQMQLNLSMLDNYSGAEHGR